MAANGCKILTTAAPTSTASRGPAASTAPRVCNGTMFQISSRADADRIRGCTEIHGNVQVVNFAEPLLQLDDLETLDGSLSVRDSGELIRLEAPKLKKVLLLSMERCTSLVALEAPALSEATELHWTVLPIFSNANLNFGSVKGLQSLVISDTSLASVSGVSAQNMTRFDVNNNRFMEKIDAQVQSVSNQLHITANCENAEVDLSLLKSTQNLSVHDAGSINLDKLEKCTGSMSLQNNEVANLSLPHLESVGGTLNVHKNPQLVGASFPKVAEISGGLVISENNKLASVDMFPQLAVIGGALEISGNIKQISMDSIRLIRGSAKVKSNDPAFSCSDFSKNAISRSVRGGKNECTNSQNQNFVSTTPTDGSAAANFSTPQSLSALAGAAVQKGSYSVLVAAALAVVF